MNLASVMKRLVIAASLLFSGINQNTSTAAEVALAGALAPVLIPIAQDILSEARDGLKVAMKKLSQRKTRCGMCNKGFACKKKLTFSACKGMCTTVQQVGGIEIRIRFGEGWSMAGCVRNGVASGLQAPAGKGKIKSIAVYSQPDLDHLMKLIALRIAAEEIASSNGANLTREDLKRMKISKQDAIDQARQTIAKITESIAMDVARGRYGNQ